MAALEWMLESAAVFFKAFGCKCPGLLVFGCRNRFRERITALGAQVAVKGFCTFDKTKSKVSRSVARSKSSTPQTWWTSTLGSLCRLCFSQRFGARFPSTQTFSGYLVLMKFRIHDVFRMSCSHCTSAACMSKLRRPARTSKRCLQKQPGYI